MPFVTFQNITFILLPSWLNVVWTRATYVLRINARKIQPKHSLYSVPLQLKGWRGEGNSRRARRREINFLLWIEFKGPPNCRARGTQAPTCAARTAAEVFPEPPLPRKVTSFVDSPGESADIAAEGAEFLLQLVLLRRREFESPRGWRWAAAEEQDRGPPSDAIFVAEEAEGMDDRRSGKERAVCRGRKSRIG